MFHMLQRTQAGSLEVWTQDVAQSHAQGLRFFRYPNQVSKAIEQELWWNTEDLLTRAEAAQRCYPKLNPSGSRAWLLLIMN